MVVTVTVESLAAQFKLLCNSNVNGQWFKCEQISICFYNPGLGLWHPLVQAAAGAATVPVTGWHQSL